MNFFNKLFRDEDFEQLLYDFELNEKDGITIGQGIDINPDLFVRFMEVWSKRVDTVIQIGNDSIYTSIASRWRAFTYREYAALHNKDIKEASFPFYPVFNQLRRKEGGINFEKQRYYYVTEYTYDKEDYVRILIESGFNELMNFFLTQRAKLSAYLPYSALLSHVYVCAPTGWGKSVLLRTIFFHLQRKYKKHSLVLIDPHGDLAEAVKRSKLNLDHERVIYIDPFFKDGYTPTFNPFQINDKSLQNLVHVVEANILAFEEILSREGGKITEAMIDTLEKALYFLLQREDSNILDLQSLLNAESSILEEAIAFDKFFAPPYDKKGNRTREGLLFRVGRLLNSPVLRNLLVGKSTFNLEQATNSNSVVIFNLGGLGEMTSVSFGKLLVASLKSMVRKRKKGGSKHTFLMIDEAHNFVTGSFEYLLSQLRGFGLHGIFATQYIEQLGDQARSVKENTAIKIVANEDTETLKKMISPPKNQSLEKFEFFLKVRHRSILKFKSPDTLINHPKRYELNTEEEQLLDSYLLKNYYKPTDGARREEEDEMGIKDVDTLIDQILPKATLKPPFELFINEDANES